MDLLLHRKNRIVDLLAIGKRAVRKGMLGNDLRNRVFDTQIPFSVRAAESAQEGQSIFAYDKGGKVAAAYEAVTKEVLEHESKERHRSRSDGVR